MVRPKKKHISQFCFFREKKPPDPGSPPKAISVKRVNKNPKNPDEIPNHLVVDPADNEKKPDQILMILVSSPKSSIFPPAPTPQRKWRFWEGKES